jgi:hypothetical protein
VEALDYLDDIDDEFVRTSRTRGFHPHTIDLAHVRWAAGTAVTAIDLCAAALGNWYCGVPGDNHALDLADVRSQRNKLPPSATAWVERVWTDPEYETLRKVRNPFTHRRLPRHLTVGGRTAFPISPSKTVGSRELVLLARDVARRHVQDFFVQIEARRIGP